jgi:hypothetical protein
MSSKHLSIAMNVIRLGSGIASLFVLSCTNVLAQATGESVKDKTEATLETEQPKSYDDIPKMGNSTEQGQVSLEDSFGPADPRDLVLALRKKALQDTHVDVQLRTFYLNRDRFDSSESEALALGGYIGFKTGYFRGRFALGATAFTSQRLYGPQDKGGTNLLAPIQQGYTVIGEIYGQYKLAEDVMLNIGRKGINTSYINESDSRMTPNTFQLAAVQGQKNSADGSSNWRFGAGYVDKMKQRTSEKFISMSAAAGIDDGVDRGVYLGGFNFHKQFPASQLSVGAVNYYSSDLINIFYSEINYKKALTNSVAL